MPPPDFHSCKCPRCRDGTDHPDVQYHRQVNVLLAQLNRQQRRLYAAVESNRIGRGGDSLLSLITGLSPGTIRSGRALLSGYVAGQPFQPDGHSSGRPSTESKYPGVTSILERILADEIAGDPMSDEKWVRNSVEHLSERLREHGINVTGMTVWRLLKKMKYSMKYNKRRRMGSGHDSPRRDEQFRYIAAKRQAFQAAGLPVISVDTKKKELIANFRNEGRSWCKEAPEVDDHDFPSSAECRAVPFGVYDLIRNAGYVIVGVSNNTPEFAVNAIARWWGQVGRREYPSSKEILVLADGGGANGCRVKAWKVRLQERLCDRYGLAVTVCHYPPGCSKWNPVERRLFSQISINWAGKPLRSLTVMLRYIRGTTTETGLSVQAHLDENTYRKGQKVSRDEMDRLNLQRHDTCPDWNYTLRPR
jgi:DDE family transposase